MKTSGRKRSPQDSTLRNVRAAKTRHVALARRVADLEYAVKVLLRRVGRLE